MLAYNSPRKSEATYSCAATATGARLAADIEFVPITARIRASGATTSTRPGMPRRSRCSCNRSGTRAALPGSRATQSVVDSGAVVGFVSIGDLVKYRIERIEGEAEAMRSYIQSA